MPRCHDYFQPFRPERLLRLADGAGCGEEGGCGGGGGAGAAIWQGRGGEEEGTGEQGGEERGGGCGVEDASHERERVLVKEFGALTEALLLAVRQVSVSFTWAS